MDSGARRACWGTSAARAARPARRSAGPALAWSAFQCAGGVRWSIPPAEGIRKPGRRAPSTREGCQPRGSPLAPAAAHFSCSGTPACAAPRRQVPWGPPAAGMGRGGARGRGGGCDAAARAQRRPALPGLPRVAPGPRPPLGDLATRMRASGRPLRRRPAASSRGMGPGACSHPREPGLRTHCCSQQRQRPPPAAPRRAPLVGRTGGCAGGCAGAAASPAPGPSPCFGTCRSCSRRSTCLGVGAGGGGCHPGALQVPVCVCVCVCVCVRM